MPRNKKQKVQLADQLQKMVSNSQKIRGEIRKQLKSQLKPQRQKSMPTIERTYSIQKEHFIPSPKLIQNKQKQVSSLSRNLSEKIYYDHRDRIQVYNEEMGQNDRLSKLQKKIEEINKKNQMRLKEISQFENKVIKKMSEDFQKDLLIQKKLKQQFQKAKQEQIKIKALKAVREQLQDEDWNQINQQKRKLEKMINNFNKQRNQSSLQKVQQLLKQKAVSSLPVPIVIEKTKNGKSSPVFQQTQQPVYLQRQRSKQDAKQLGKKYLQHAKKLQAVVKEKPKIKLFDINIRNIDYGAHMLEKIARRTGDLSRVPHQEKPKVKEEVHPPQTTITEINPITHQPIPINNNQEIEKYLKQIKDNLQVLQSQKDGSEKQPQQSQSASNVKKQQQSLSLK